VSGYNFTDRVRRVLILAREQAGRLGHEYVSPDHILLGILTEGNGVAAAAIVRLGVALPTLGAALEARMKPGKQVSPSLDLPYTSRAKKVLELAMAEARELHHQYVGTEHLLLGVLREGKNKAAAVLMEHGLPAGRVRAEIVRLLGSEIAASPPAEAWVGPALSPEALATGARVRVALLLSVIALLAAVAALVITLSKQS
jgi:ATP-dependent Clp protease ATP-binding subunit ClpC